MTHPTLLRRHCLKAAIAAALALPLLGAAGCGFRLRGSSPNSAGPAPALRATFPAQSGVGRHFPGAYAAQGGRILEDAVQKEEKKEGEGKAQNSRQTWLLEVLDERRERIEVGSTATGYTSEYQLRLTLRYRMHPPQNQQAHEPAELVQTAALSYQAKDALAKQHEEETLFQALEENLARQLVQRVLYVQSH